MATTNSGVYSGADTSIAAAGSLSTSVACPTLITGILIDCTTLAWAAAAISFQASLDGTNFFDLYDKTNTEVSLASFTITAGAGKGRYMAVDPDTFSGIRYLKIRSGVTALAVAQAAGATLTVCGRS